MSVLFSILIWCIVTTFVTELSLAHFIIIEICITVGQLFSNFVKEQTGLKAPQPSEEL